MTASRRNVASAFLHRAGLLAGILAVLAGILGMHVLTGTHSMHSPAAITAAAMDHTESAAADGHPDHGAADTSSIHGTDVQVAGISIVEHCSCSASCAGMPTMTSCTPLGKTGSLSVPLPGTAVIGVISDARAPGAVPGPHSYLPCSPSPGELSISRT